MGRANASSQLERDGHSSSYDPYTVSVDFDRDDLTDVACDCPYDWGGWCKHIIATLLVCLHEPERTEKRPTINDLLADLDRAQLHHVLIELVKSDASLIDKVEQGVALVKPGTSLPSPQRGTIDLTSVRRQVSAIVHSLDHMRRSEAYWHVASVVDRLRQMLTRVHDWIEKGDTANAFSFLEAVTGAYVEEWVILDDSDGDPRGFFAHLGDAWESAALAADLSPVEGKQWAKKLDHWQEQLSGYELDGAFELARMAIEG